MAESSNFEACSHISERVREIVAETMKIRGNKRLIDYKEEAEILQTLIKSGDLSQQEIDFVQQNLNKYKMIVKERERQYRIEQLEYEITNLNSDKTMTTFIKDTLTRILEDTTEDGAYTEETLAELHNLLEKEDLNKFEQKYIENLLSKNKLS